MKIDFKKSLTAYRARHGKFAIVDIPPLQYLMIDGREIRTTLKNIATRSRRCFRLPMP